jgi:hypothetical protein
MRISAAWIVVSLAACAEETVCERAADKLQACHIGEKTFAKGYARIPLAIDRDHCSGQNECLAKCVDPASCSDLDYVLVSGVADPNLPPPTGHAELLACISACMQ